MYNHKWSDNTLTKQTSTGRIIQLDVLRGLAVLGIYWINVAVFGLPSGSYVIPSTLGSTDWLNVGVWIHSEVFVEGAMRGLFSLLFGASALVFLNDVKLSSDGLKTVDHYYRRTLLLILFGLIHSYLLLWPYDVLYAYGVLGLFIFPLRKLSVNILLGLGCVLLIVSDIDFVDAVDQTNSTILRPETTTSTALNYSGKNLSGINQIDVQEMEIGVYRSNYFNIAKVQVHDVIYQHSTALYRNHVFDIGGMMLVGMAMLKLGVLSGLRSVGFYWALFVFGFTIGGSLRGISAYTEVVEALNQLEILKFTYVKYSLGRLPIIVGYVGFIGLICKSRYLHTLQTGLGAVGRLALTNYIAQTLISITIFYGFGLGWFALFERYQLIYICVAVWVFQIAFSLVWLRYFIIGPIEWLWRTMIYGRIQQFKVKKVQPPL